MLIKHLYTTGSSSFGVADQYSHRSIGDSLIVQSHLDTNNIYIHEMISHVSVVLLQVLGSSFGTKRLLLRFK